MTLAVPTAAELEALAERVRKLEARAALETPSGYTRGRNAPGGPRRWRRLREAGKVTGYRIEGRGREWFYKDTDIAALMVPVVPPPKEKSAPALPKMVDARAYADARLDDLLRGGNRAA